MPQLRPFTALLLLAACGSSTPTPGPPATPDADGEVVPPPPTDGPVLLVANKQDATLSILALPGGEPLATLETGVGPHEIALSPDGRRAVVTSYGDQATLGRSLTVVDLARLSVERTIDLDPYRRPHGVAFVDADRVLVTSETNASVVLVDVTRGEVERGIFTSQEGSHMLALSPDASRAYVANIGSGTITPIDLAAGAAGEPVAVVPASEGIAVTPDGAEVWTASLKDDVIVALDAATLAERARIDAVGMPIRLTVTPDGATMLVTNATGSVVQLVDVASRAVETVAFAPLAGETAVPLGTVIARDGATAYVALVAENRVAVIDLATREITGHLPTGNGPDGIAYSTYFTPG